MAPGAVPGQRHRAGWLHPHPETLVMRSSSAPWAGNGSEGAVVTKGVGAGCWNGGSRFQRACPAPSRRLSAASPSTEAPREGAKGLCCFSPPAGASGASHGALGTGSAGRRQFRPGLSGLGGFGADCGAHIPLPKGRRGGQVWRWDGPSLALPRGYGMSPINHAAPRLSHLHQDDGRWGGAPQNLPGEEPVSPRRGQTGIGTLHCPESRVGGRPASPPGSDKASRVPPRSMWKV